MADLLAALRRRRLSIASTVALALAVRCLRDAYVRLSRGIQLSEGGVCLVTGASSGVGAAVAEELARRGAAKVILVARGARRLTLVSERVSAAGAEPIIVAADCSDCEAVRRMANMVMAVHGCPSILVLAAGAGRWRRLTEMSTEQALGCSDAPYHSSLLVSRAFLVDMLTLPRAHICLPQSPASYCAVAGATAYVASRWALRGLYEALWSDCLGSSVTISQVVMNEVADSAYFDGDDGESHRRMPRISGLLGAPVSSAVCAEAVVNTIERGASSGSSNPMLALNIELQSLVPNIYAWLTALTSSGRYISQANPDRLHDHLT